MPALAAGRSFLLDHPAASNRGIGERLNRYIHQVHRRAEKTK